MFEYTLVGGIVASGADAYLLHVTTTPSVAYITRMDDFDWLISTNHNSFCDNRFKLLNHISEKIYNSVDYFSVSNQNIG